MCGTNEVPSGPWEVHGATWLVLTSFLNVALYFSSFSLFIFIFYNDVPKFLAVKFGQAEIK